MYQNPAFRRTGLSLYLQSGGGVVRNYGTMYAMRPLRNFKTNQCCHLISRIANCAKLDLIDFKPATNVLRFRDMGSSEDE